ncbi:hypothetical protein V8C42DRAFT_339068 [Trichoderma barbatum]
MNPTLLFISLFAALTAATKTCNCPQPVGGFIVNEGCNCARFCVGAAQDGSCTRF